MSQPPFPDQPAPSDGTVMVSTTPIPLTVRVIDDDRVPPGETGFGAYLADRLVARNALPSELIDRLPLAALFADPVPLVFQVGLGIPGIRGTLFALVPFGPMQAAVEPEEPWAASVPKFEAEAAAETGAAEPVLFPLGILVRTARDRKFPGDLPREAADLLRTALSGETHEVVDRVLDDLLGAD